MNKVTLPIKYYVGLWDLNYPLVIRVESLPSISTVFGSIKIKEYILGSPETSQNEGRLVAGNIVSGNEFHGVGVSGWDRYGAKDEREVFVKIFAR